MTLYEAVLALRRFNHRGTADWWSARYGGATTVNSPAGTFVFSEQEAIAIAKALVEKDEVNKPSESEYVTAEFRLHTVETRCGGLANREQKMVERVRHLENAMENTRKEVQSLKDSMSIRNYQVSHEYIVSVVQGVLEHATIKVQE